MNKKLNLFLIKNIKLSKSSQNNVVCNTNLNLIKYLDFKSYKEFKSYILLFKCLLLLKNLKKTIFMYNELFITVFFKESSYSSVLLYKIKKIESAMIFKLYSHTNASIFINVSSNFIKFKSEHENYIEFSLDCFHANFSKKKMSTLNSKITILALYSLI